MATLPQNLAEDTTASTKRGDVHRIAQLDATNATGRTKQLFDGCKSSLGA
jgi:hypothetical protein